MEERGPSVRRGGKRTIEEEEGGGGVGGSRGQRVTGTPLIGGDEIS